MELLAQTIKVLVARNLAAQTTYEVAASLGGTTYVVGGAVRDLALGKEPKDLDLLVTGVPMDSLESALSEYGKAKYTGGGDKTGQAFGVIHFAVGGDHVEVALPRVETSTGGSHRDFDVTYDHNIPVEVDLGRRDFTANSMAINLNMVEVAPDQALVDPYNGLQDLMEGTLRMVHPNTFKEDPLRIVRAITSFARHGLMPDQETEKALQESADKIRNLPGERIQLELDKILGSQDPATALEIAHKTGILDYILPEISNAMGFDQHNTNHNLGVGEHLLAVLRKMAELTDDVDLRLAALLHDIGKPDSFWMDEEGKGHFYCLGPSEKILTSTLNWVEASTLKRGDKIIAFDENPVGKGRRWRLAEILDTGKKKLPSYRIHLENGQTIVCSENHMWLVGKGVDRVWRCTKDLNTRSKIILIIDTWDIPAGFEEGWLAGFLDGEGTSTRTHIGFAQKPGIVLDKAIIEFKKRGFDIYQWQSPNASAIQCRIKGGVAENLRVLGLIRPIRLLEKYERLLFNKQNNEGAIVSTKNRIRVTKIEGPFDHEVITLASSTKTLIVHGLASHNSHPDYPESANHEEVGADMAKELMGRLRYPKNRIDRVVSLIEKHMFDYPTTEKGMRRHVNNLGGDHELAQDLYTLREADASGKKDGEIDPEDWLNIDHGRTMLQKHMDSSNAVSVGHLAINGNDLIQLGVPQGPQIGQILNSLLDRVIEDPTLNDKNTLLQIVENDYIKYL